MQFTATEVGFENGLGGASNSKSDDPYHYFLFGHQPDPVPGVYFEFDDQINGDVDIVRRISIGADQVEFALKAHPTITVMRGDITEAKWQEFIRGIRDTFQSDIIQSSK